MLMSLGKAWIHFTEHLLELMKKNSKFKLLVFRKHYRHKCFQKFLNLGLKIMTIIIITQPLVMMRFWIPAGIIQFQNDECSPNIHWKSAILYEQILRNISVLWTIQEKNGISCCVVPLNWNKCSLSLRELWEYSWKT